MASRPLAEPPQRPGAQHGVHRLATAGRREHEQREQRDRDGIWKSRCMDSRAGRQHEQGGPPASQLAIVLSLDAVCQHPEDEPGRASDETVLVADVDRVTRRVEPLRSVTAGGRVTRGTR